MAFSSLETIDVTATLGTLNVQKYFFQLTRGCGNSACENSYCASNPNAPDYAGNARAAPLALDLAKRTKPNSHFFCPAIFSLTTTVWQPRSDATATAESSGSYGSASGTSSETPSDGGLPDDLVDVVVAEEEIEFGEVIGKGSFGIVYKGNWLGTHVALKKLYATDDPHHVAMARRETRMLQLVRHPNILQFMGVCRSEGGLFLVTEYLPLGDMSRILRNREVGLSWKLRVRWCMDVARAMAYLHRLGIIHRDLKTKNLLVDSQYKAKICDFGLARKSRKARQRMTICGTMDFMAPEIGLGKKYDSSADVFSYGVVIVEVIARGKKIPRTSDFTVDFEALIKPEGCPKKLLGLSKRCCSEDPSDRPSFSEALKTISTKVRSTLPTEDSDIWDVNEESSRVSSSMLPGSGTVIHNDVSPKRRAAPTPPSGEGGTVDALAQALADADMARRLQVEEEEALSAHMSQLTADEELARGLQASFNQERSERKKNKRPHKMDVKSHRDGAPAAVHPRAGRHNNADEQGSYVAAVPAAVVKTAGNLFAQIRGSIAGRPALKRASERQIDEDRVLVTQPRTAEEEFMNAIHGAIDQRRPAMDDEDDDDTGSEWASTVVRLPKE